jgi:hypothetical protein
MACKLGRHRQSDGARTYDKNLRYSVSHFTQCNSCAYFLIYLRHLISSLTNLYQPKTIVPLTMPTCCPDIGGHPASDTFAPDE